MKNLMKVLSFVSIICLIGGCDSSDNESEGSANEYGGPACVTQSDCGENAACVSAAGLSVCQPICTGSVDECGVSASCGSIGATSIDVCQPAKEETSTEEATEENAPDPEEQATLPCVTDEDCSKFDSRAICAQWQGTKDCTIPCSQESDCDVPAIGGFSVDFMTCLSDEADPSRMACLPDAACFENPINCITLPSMPGLEGFDGFGMGEDEEGDEDDDFDFDF